MSHVEDRWTAPGPDGKRIRTDRYGTGMRWRAVWNEPDGSRRRRSFTSKDAANAHLQNVGVDVRTGSYVSPAASAATFGEVAERWYEEQAHQRASSLKAVRRRLDRTILPSLGGLSWSAIDRTVIQRAVTSWTKDLKPSTVRVAYVYLAAICAHAVDERRVVVSPCKKINLPPADRSPIVPMRAELVQALTDAAAERYRPMFILAAASGLRPSELRGLTWDRITASPGGAQVRVDRQLLRGIRALEPRWGPLKTEYSPRTIAIGKATLVALGPRGKGLVFTTTHGGAITQTVAWSIWQKAAEGLGIASGDGWHELRHFHASLLIAAGSSPVAVAHRLGHKDANETLSTYAHLWPDDDERMRDASDGVITLPGSGQGAP